MFIFYSVVYHLYFFEEKKKKLRVDALEFVIYIYN